jgi:hypothetical protein
LVRQRFEQGGVDKGENADGCGDAKRDDKNRGKGESWSLAELAEREVEIS